LNKRTAIQRERVYIMGDAIGTTKERENRREEGENAHLKKNHGKRRRGGGME
jgi:hypothetical protein